MRFLSILLAVALCAFSRPSSASEPLTVISSDSIKTPRQPQLAVVDDKTLFLVFGAGESIYICKSSDGGKSFAMPTEIGSLQNLALGMRRGPRVVANTNSVIVTAISHKSGDLTAWQSNDDGMTWSNPVVVNDIPYAAREGLHGMAMGSKDDVFCAWLDLRHGKTQIFGSTSPDGGRTWGQNRKVYESPSGTVCECCHPSVVIDDTGVVYVMWRNVVEGNRDMYIAKSTNGGKSFHSERKLGVGTWNLNACPMDGGDLGISPSGDVVTVWRRKNQIFASSFAKPLRKRFLGVGEQPDITMSANGEFIVWLNRRGGDLKLLEPSSTSATTLAENATDPVIAAARSSSSNIIAAWEAGSIPNTTIQAIIVAK